jgi:hypothetical protein
MVQKVVMFADEWHFSTVKNDMIERKIYKQLKA